jgi:serpin B
MRRSVAISLLAGTLALAACGNAARPLSEPAGVTTLGASVDRVVPEASADDVRALTGAQLDFAIDLYRTVGDEVDGDLAIGPGSLHTALSMIRAGARGQTATEMDDVLHAGALDGRLHELGNALDRQLRSRSDADGVELALANRVWADDSLELLDDYVTLLSTQYGAGLATLDLSGDPEQARATVNAWVADATRDKIEELFPAGSITADARLVLTNAVYLDAAWKFPFDRVSTSNEPFYLEDGSTVEVPTMRYSEYLPSGRGPGWSAVRLPYDGEELSMTVIVPEDLSAFEQTLDAARLEQVDDSIKDGGIHLSLPRFTARTHLALAETLAEMGMPTALGDEADFSGMTGARDLFLSAVEHEVVVEVDEEGTEAAAASGGLMAGSHGPTVTVDRPFLFLVRDEATGAVLFLGRVTDPR